MTNQKLPLKNIQPCDTLDHHTHTGYKIEKGPHHNIESCGQEITSLNNRGSAHRPCSFFRQPVSAKN